MHSSMYTTEPSMQKKEPSSSSSSSSFPRRRRTPSFSSSLLDSIYHSMDESTSSHYRETANEKKQSVSTRREIMIENWVEKKKISYPRSSSTSSSSGNSSVGIFSSEAESSCRKKSRRKAAPAPVMFDLRETEFSRKPQREGGFTKTKLKALKMYSELKKVKQPISPGGRISAFLSSIFNGNTKKVKICSVGGMDDVCYGRKSKSEYLSAPPFSSSSNPKKRSVRLSHQDSSSIPAPTISTRKSQVLKNFVMEKRNVNLRQYQEEKGAREFHYDDDASCSSSELFELDHLIGIGRYREELPVYETTDFRTNRAIANGFVF